MWTNKKLSKHPFKGSYEKDKDGERIFVLRFTASGPEFKNARKITFESWQAAKKAGWIKAK